MTRAVDTSARRERAALCDLFLEVGPDAPTLCGDWTTRDLAAHLVMRERRPDGALGIVGKPFAKYADKVQSGIADQPWEKLVETVRSGPPVWSPMRLGAVDRFANTVEFYVHHEDVRRAGESWTARDLDAELVADLRRVLSKMATPLTRKCDVGLTLSPTDGGDDIVANSKQPMVTGRAPLGELVLFVYGRQTHSDVELDGEPDAVETVRSASFGI